LTDLRRANGGIIIPISFSINQFIREGFQFMAISYIMPAGVFGSNHGIGRDLLMQKVIRRVPEISVLRSISVIESSKML